MGRRKIEIQAIANERNRSVTFIKRKNGLFKKAYELGVLCSVDVAVIIFDERPGHSRKLYEYSSCDIRNIIQRHVRHDGETDSRSAADFSGNAPASKDEDDGDDDVDEDDAVLLASMKSGGSKRRDDGTLKSGLAQDIHPGYSRGGHSQEIIELSPRLPSPQPLYNDHRSSIPISNDRLRPAHEHQSKRPRLQLPSMDLIQRQPYSRSGSPSSGPASPLLEGTGSYPYPTQFQHQQLELPHSQHRYNHHQNQNQNQNQHQYSQYAPLFPLRQSRGPTPPPPSFVPLQSDFSLSAGARQGDGRGPSAFPPPGSWGSGGQDRNGRGGRSGGGGDGGGVTADLFAALIDAREESRAAERRASFAPPPGLAVSSSTFGLDWPVHNPGTSDNMGPTSAVSSIGSTGDGASSEGRSSAGASTTDWLDFLSGNSGVVPPPSAASSRGMGAPWAHGGGDSRSMDSDGELFGGMGHGMEGQGVKKEING